MILDNRQHGGGADVVARGALSYFTKGSVGHFINRHNDRRALTVMGMDINGSSRLPLVALVGPNTVSFGEIYSGVLRDMGRATIIGELTGGIAATGNYPGKARNAEELRRDLDVVYRLLPGSHRLNLHAIYLESDRPVERNAIEPRHYAAWLDWAKANGHGMDFNPTCFSHSKAAEGFTLSHRDPAIRQFWIEHCIASRKIGEYFGKELGTPAVTNIWIPDGAYIRMPGPAH